MSNSDHPPPPGWNPDTNIAEVLAEIHKRLRRLEELDLLARQIQQERLFIHALIAQLLATGHS